MSAGMFAAGVVVLLWTAGAALPLHASDLEPLKITLLDSNSGENIEPVGRRIVIRRQPIHLTIRIQNTSEAAVLIRVQPEQAYAVELKDEAGRLVTVKRKKQLGETLDDRRVNLSPGGERIIPMKINRDTWEGVPALTPGKESKYTARIVYESAGGQHVYSEPYTLIFNLLE